LKKNKGEKIMNSEKYILKHEFKKNNKENRIKLRSTEDIKIFLYTKLSGEYDINLKDQKLYIIDGNLKEILIQEN